MSVSGSDPRSLRALAQVDDFTRFEDANLDELLIGENTYGQDSVSRIRGSRKHGCGL